MWDLKLGSVKTEYIPESGTASRLWNSLTHVYKAVSFIDLLSENY